MLSVHDALFKLAVIAEDLDGDAPLEVLDANLNTVPVTDIEIIDDHVIVHFEGSPRPHVRRELLGPDELNEAQKRLRGDD